MAIQSLQISTEQFNKKFLKYDTEKEILTYKNSKFHLVTPYITIFNDKFDNSNVYDDKLIQIFSDIETLMGDKMNNSILSKYTNKNKEDKIIIKLKPHQDLSTEEAEDLKNTQNKKYRLMIAFSPMTKYKGGYILDLAKSKSRNDTEETHKCLSYRNGIFPKIVRVASKEQEKGKNEYESCKFE